MKKVVIFTEGQSELIFIRQLLFHLIDNAKLSFDCMALRGQIEHSVPFKYQCPNPQVYFLIINVGNDERVLSVIKEREERLISSGYERIIGLRDLYSRAYRERSATIDDQVSNEFITSFSSTLGQMNHCDKIVLYLAIMELEAWFLGMYNLFSKINNSLTVEYIEQQCGFNLRNIDPQKEFFKPSNELEQIFLLIGMQYSKSLDDMEMITSNLDNEDFLNAIENNRCESFRAFRSELIQYG
jgi:hypothetical protein